MYKVLRIIEMLYTIKTVSSTKLIIAQTGQARGLRLNLFVGENIKVIGNKLQDFRPNCSFCNRFKDYSFISTPKQLISSFPKLFERVLLSLYTTTRNICNKNHFF